MLDQLTDRAATMCLLVVLSHFYPRYMFLFQLSMTIDIVAHWLHLHTWVLGEGSGNLVRIRSVEVLMVPRDCFWEEKKECPAITTTTSLNLACNTVCSPWLESSQNQFGLVKACGMDCAKWEWKFCLGLVTKSTWSLHHLNLSYRGRRNFEE